MGNTSCSAQSHCGKSINYEAVWEKGQLSDPSAEGQRLIHYAEQQPTVVLDAIADS